jgi:hypothetical protein
MRISGIRAWTIVSLKGGGSTEGWPYGCKVRQTDVRSLEDILNKKN